MFLKVYLIALTSFFTIDMIWLGLIAKNLYAKQIGHLMKTNINWLAAIIFYLIFVFGIVIFVINPSLEKNSLKQAIILGGLFGFICYATYDLTNLAVTKDWPVLITIIDMIWGSILTILVSLITFLISKKIGLIF